MILRLGSWISVLSGPFGRVMAARIEISESLQLRSVLC
jgi:hypothetical protein